MSNSCVFDTPAKINLGLEVLGKRPDGYHDISTVMSALELHDTLTVFRHGGGVEFAGITPADNLITRALRLFASATNQTADLGWNITKRVPIAAGLGGASGNAAGALLAANRLANDRLPWDQLLMLAASLGSDVPFFLTGPWAVATGRGTELEPLSPLSLDVLLLVPDIQLNHKTASMYSALTAADYGTSHQTTAIRGSLEAGTPPTIEMLRNGFLEPLMRVVPHLRSIPQHLERLGVTWGLSGAGPTFYVLGDSTILSDVARSVSAIRHPTVRPLFTRTRTRPLAVRVTP